MSELLQGDAIIVSEVGQNQMWTAQHYCFKHPRTWITSGGLGTMGYGLPAAMGAHFARPDLPVFDVAGDGSIQMNIQEFGTISHNKIPVKIAILNNRFLGMVRQWQELSMTGAIHSPSFRPLSLSRSPMPTVLMV